MEAYSTKSPFLPSALSAASRFLFRSNPEFIDSLLASWYTAKRSQGKQGKAPDLLEFLRFRPTQRNPNPAQTEVATRCCISNFQNLESDI